MPTPLSRTTNFDRLAAAADVNVDVTTGIRELSRVVQDVGQDLNETDAIAVDDERIGRYARRHTMALGHKRAPARVERVGHDVADIYRLPAKGDTSHREARHIQQIVDQAHQMLDLTLHGLPHLFPDVAVRRPRLHGERVADGRQRIAQLVRQHGEELVLAVIGVAKRFFRPPPVVDVEDRAVPFGDGSGCVPLRQRSRQLPAIGPAHSAQAILGLEWPTRLARASPQMHLRRDVVGMHVRNVAVAEESFDGSARVLGGARRQVIETTVGCRPPQKCRRRFTEEANLLFAVSELGFHP